ncbi:HNH endonuclease [Leptospira sp. FAT2]|uniref:HNH endonuclease n=1 Tax=Leptospira sanjuanensis TaxID=2879643 RepID=UPI001EE86331|nr:HNH endonuclease signature motif containing protein [Leptospira sanjuanensis]MCG6192301.1 HNH endonuclease [Leptospira sanjuanensis]
MKLNKFLKEKYKEAILFNINQIRKKNASILDEASMICREVNDPGSKNIFMLNFYSEYITKFYIEREVLKKHHYKFLKSLREEYSYMEKVYKQRNFPPSLRDHIFLRDRFCCQQCGISKEGAIANGFHLEVDHIKEWADGGLTCFSNGQTICSKCNIGKHHAKNQRNAKKKRNLARV